MLRSVRKFVAIATPRSRSDDAERVLGKPEGIRPHSGISLVESASGRLNAANADPLMAECRQPRDGSGAIYSEKSCHPQGSGRIAARQPS